MSGRENSRLYAGSSVGIQSIIPRKPAAAAGTVSGAGPRLTLNYGLRVDFAAISVPEVPKRAGRFNIGNWRYDARFEFCNVLNNGVVLE